MASSLVRSTLERAVRGHCVVFLGKTLYSHSASLTQVYKWVPANLMLRGNPAKDEQPA